jgi:DNA-binding NarL/FixJ family response regulator
MFAPSVTRRLVEQYVTRPAGSSNGGDAVDTLTEREREVLTEMARGLSNVEIAERLHVSHGTVKTHVSRILAKLELRDRVQAVIVAYECGLIGAKR